MNPLKKIAMKFLDGLEPFVNRLALYGSSEAAVQQIMLQAVYRNALAAGLPVPGFRDVGFRLFSQVDEDGILLFIFSLIGHGSRRCVEIGAGSGIECNTANLIINHAWTGLLIDGDGQQIALGQKFYRKHHSTRIFPPTLLQAWIKRDNINALLSDHGISGEIDLLSIDIDGMDYWIWQAIDSISPKVVIVEAQDIIGPEKALSVPYADDFDAYKYSTSQGVPNYCGASASAFVKLARAKGYRLVACNTYGFNLFFMRNDVGAALFPEIPVSECFKHPKTQAGMRDRWSQVENLPWIEV